MTTVTSIKELMIPGRIMGVLVNENNFNAAVASTLGCEITDVPPLVEGHQVLNFNGEVIHVINWVNSAEDHKTKEDIPWGSNPHMVRSAVRSREIMKINTEVHTSGQLCVMFAGYEQPEANNFFHRDIKCQVPMKALFLTATAVLVKDNREVFVLRQSNGKRLDELPPFKIL